MSEPGSLFTGKSIRKLLIPLIFEQLMIVMVGLVDTMMLSGVGQNALAAFSLVDSINLLFMQVFMAVGAGGSIIAAQYIGNKDRKGAESTATQTLILVLMISIFMALPGLLFTGPLLSLIYPSISSGIRAYARQYFFLTCLSYPLYALYNSGTSMLYAQGFSRLSMLTSVVMNSAKILLNLVLIRHLQMDVIGAGIATITSRLIGGGMVTFFLMNQQAPIHYTKPTNIRFNSSTIRRILSVALPSGLENIIFLASKLAIGMMIATYSGAMIAANAAANTISTYVSIPANAINLVTITVVSQCIGARRGEEARAFTKKLQAATYGSIFLMAALVALFVNPIVGMLNLGPEAYGHTRQIILIYCGVSLLLWAPAFGLPNSLRAAGDNRFVMFAAVLSVLLFRVAGSFVFGNLLNMQVHGIWYAMYLDWIARSVFFVWRFRSGKWLEHRLV